MLNTVTTSICLDYKRPQHELINSMLRALDAANAYPSDMIGVAAQIQTGVRSIVHFMAGTIDTGGASDETGNRECDRGRHPFKNENVEGCFIEGGCYWDEPPRVPKPDEQQQMFAFFLPPCPENSEPDVTGKVCRCSRGYDGEFHVVTEEGDQRARPTYVPAHGHQESCTLVGGICDVLQPHPMVLDDGSPAKGTIGEKANVKCADGYIPSGEATCGGDGRWSPETTCTFLPSVAPPVPVCGVPRGVEYDTGSCEDCQGTEGKPWEPRCSCHVMCAEGFKSTGEVQPGDKTCKIERYACPEGAQWTREQTCVDAQGSQTSQWCCEEAWGSTVPPDRLSRTAPCATLTDHRSCMLAQDRSDGAPCCWRHEGFGDGDAPKCLPMSDSRLAELTPTGSCAIEKFVPAASWEAFPTCTKTCSPILHESNVLPKDCDNCVPGDCKCTVRCEEGFERFGGGPEHDVRDCQSRDHSLTPVAPVCFRPGDFPDLGRRRCGAVIRSSELLLVVEGCQNCRSGKEDCYCKARCPDHTRWVGGGPQDTPLKCVSEEGHGVQVNIVKSCEEITDPRQCANSIIREVPSGREVPCCFRSSGFADGGGTICARQGSPLITWEIWRPEICTERLQSHWEPLPECKPLCDRGPLDAAPHVEVSRECGDCVVGQERTASAG
ncbi:unnamed protein product [Prorocentrum cordatum]|uniref:Sushi domain-containing protein n=1 Tax=Prorocentrum cordatum TaxID=2364126 RepID=A0ABN9WZ94_9DINO|nr:unnamed protein product [Polarella glacialis]